MSDADVTQPTNSPGPDRDAPRLPEPTNSLRELRFDVDAPNEREARVIASRIIASCVEHPDGWTFRMTGAPRCSARKPVSWRFDVTAMRRLSQS